MKRLLLASAALVLGFATAAQADDTLNLDATAESVCTVAADSSTGVATIDFNTDILGSDAFVEDQAGSNQNLDFICNNNAGYTVTFTSTNGGLLNSSASPANGFTNTIVYSVDTTTTGGTGSTTTPTDLADVSSSTDGDGGTAGSQIGTLTEAVPNRGDIVVAVSIDAADNDSPIITGALTDTLVTTITAN